MSSSTFYGSDVSWLAGDAAGHVAWLVTNGSGIVPNQLRADPATTDQQEELLRDWVIQHGRAFRFGVGNTQWTASHDIVDLAAQRPGGAACRVRCLGVAVCAAWVGATRHMDDVTDDGHAAEQVLAVEQKDATGPDDDVVAARS